MSAQATEAAPPSWVRNPRAFTNKIIRDLCTDAGLSHDVVWRQWREAVMLDTRARIARGELADRTGAAQAEADEIATRSQPAQPRAKTVGPPRLVPASAPRIVAGRGGVSHEALRCALGKTAYELWLVLLKWRGKATGKTTATVENMMRTLHRPRRCTARALARLYAAGLVVVREGDCTTDKGFDSKGNAVWRTKPRRTVLGDLPVAYSVDDVCAVPQATERWLVELPKRGRPSTGGAWSAKGRTARRKAAAATVMEERWRVEVARELSNIGNDGNPSNGVEGVKHPARRCETPGTGGCETPGTPTDLLSLSLPPSLVHGSTNQSPRANVICDLSGETSTSPAEVPVSTPPAVVVPHPFFSTPAGRTLLSRPRPLETRTFHPVALGAPHDAIPRIPTGGALAVIIPSAPVLDAAAEDYRKVHMLRRAFEGAVEANRKALGMRGPCYTFRGVHVAKGRRRYDSPIDPTHPQFTVLLTAANLLIEHGIAFASWCAFVIEQCWVERMHGKGAPPLPVVFSPKSIHRWRGWFASGLASAGASRSVYPHVSREFMQRHDAMRAGLRDLPAIATSDDIRAHVARYFPEGFATELARVQAELDVLREEVRDRLAQGKWCWSDDSNIVDGRWCW